MSKSLENFYTIEDVEKKGIEPLALRYLYLTAHYRDPLNFTWDSLSAAQNGLNNLRKLVEAARTETGRTVLSREKEAKRQDYSNRFTKALNDDLNTAQALAILWEVMKSNIPGEDKYDFALLADEVLGLNLRQEPAHSNTDPIPQEIQNLMQKRIELKVAQKYNEADEIRNQINNLGYVIEDKAEGTSIRKK